MVNINITLPISSQKIFGWKQQSSHLIIQCNNYLRETAVPPEFCYPQNAAMNKGSQAKFALALITWKNETLIQIGLLPVSPYMNANTAIANSHSKIRLKSPKLKHISRRHQTCTWWSSMPRECAKQIIYASIQFQFRCFISCSTVVATPGYDEWKTCRE